MEPGLPRESAKTPARPRAIYFGKASILFPPADANPTAAGA